MPQKTKQPNPGPIYYRLFAFLWPQILFLKTQFFISTLTFFVLWNLICDGFEFGFSSWNQSLIVLGLHKVQSLPQALSLRFTHSLPFFNFLKLTTLYFPSLLKKNPGKVAFYYFLSFGYFSFVYMREKLKLVAKHLLSLA